MSGRRRVPTFAEGLPHTKAALEFAERAHAGQRRSDGEVFVAHPIEVASLLYYAGAPDLVIAAGMLHDVLEKGAVSVSELQRRFGARIAKVVVAVSDDDAIIDYAERKAALCRQVAAAGDDTLAVFAADKLSKARELHGELTRGNGRVLTDRQARRLTHYSRSLTMLEERLPGSPLVAQLRAVMRQLSDVTAVPAMAR